jgi:hypothetical protein
MNDQAVFPDIGRIMDEAIGTVEAVGVLIANSLNLAPHVFATMTIHRLGLLPPNDPAQPAGAATAC